MEPLRDPAIDSMSWEGWRFPERGPVPLDGMRCLLRIREISPGLCPTEQIVEVEALYTSGRWENGEGHRLADIRNLVAWQPLQDDRRKTRRV
jgi:hypothetical protein